MNNVERKERRTNWLSPSRFSGTTKCWRLYLSDVNLDTITVTSWNDSSLSDTLPHVKH